MDEGRALECLKRGASNFVLKGGGERLGPAVLRALEERKLVFLGISASGRTAIVRTRGNPHGHLVLRGGGGRPNYDSVSVKVAERALVKAGLSPNIVVDCSHANSLKDASLQPLVFMDCVHQIREGSQAIRGMMLESHINAGSQRSPADLAQLKYGVSITDACIGWETTEELLRRADRELRSLHPLASALA